MALVRHALSALVKRQFGHTSGGGATLGATGQLRHALAPQYACVADQSGFYIAGTVGGAVGLGIVSAGGAAAAGEEAALATRGGVYSLRDEIGQVVRTGRTKDFEARQNQHALDPSTTAFRFRREYATDDYAEQRGLEQVLYEGHPEAHFSNGGLNKIRGISPTNPRRAEYEEAARTYLARMR